MRQARPWFNFPPSTGARRRSERTGWDNCDRIRYHWNNPDLAPQMGEHVRQKFLIVRDRADHLTLMSTLAG